MANYGMRITLPGSLLERKSQVVEALKAQGFAILTEIDVQKTMQEKIGADYEPYLILGACNPGLANRAFTADRSIGLLLPCNVVLRQVGQSVVVEILDPESMFGIVDPETKKALTSIPSEARKKLQFALQALAQGLII